MPKFTFNGTPEQLADIVTRLNRLHTPDRTILYGEVYLTEFRASVLKHTMTSHSVRFIIGVPNKQMDSWSECWARADILPEGKTRVSTERFDGDWSQFESSWQILTDDLERDGWIGEAPDPAPNRKTKTPKWETLLVKQLYVDEGRDYAECQRIVWAIQRIIDPTLLDGDKHTSDKAVDNAIWYWRNKGFTQGYKRKKP